MDYISGRDEEMGGIGGRGRVWITFQGGMRKWEG